MRGWSTRYVVDFRAILCKKKCSSKNLIKMNVGKIHMLIIVGNLRAREIFGEDPKFED